MKLGRDVVFNPLVDGLWRGVCLYLLQQLLLQLQQREQEAQALPLQDLQHAVLVLINFCREEQVGYSESHSGNNGCLSGMYLRRGVGFFKCLKDCLSL